MFQPQDSDDSLWLEFVVSWVLQTQSKPKKCLENAHRETGKECFELFGKWRKQHFQKIRKLHFSQKFQKQRYLFLNSSDRFLSSESEDVFIDLRRAWSIRELWQIITSKATIVASAGGFNVWIEFFRNLISRRKILSCFYSYVQNQTMSVNVPVSLALFLWVRKIFSDWLQKP